MLLVQPAGPALEKGRKTMRDLYDAQAWADNHDQLTLWFGNALAAAAVPLRRGAGLAGRLPGQLLAGLFAISLTLVTFAGSAA
jgi:hypothetical protein